MAEKRVQIIIAGSSAGAVRAFEETSVAADLASKQAGDKFEAMGGRLGGIFGNVASTVLGPGNPISKGLEEVGKKFEGMGPLAQKMGAAAGPVAVLAAAATAVGIEAVKMGTEMQASDAAIAAHADISTAAAKKIGDAFLDTAGKSTFSGKEMADAFAPVAGQLGMVQGAALTAAQSTQVMQAAADLAEASGGSLSDTTAALAGVMQAYGIKAGGAADASNTLWNASRLTGTSVGDLTSTAERLHARLGDLTPSLGDTAGLLLDLKNHGETGRTAMSAMSTAFSTLLSNSKPVNTALADLGVKIYDSSGKFVGMGSVMDQLSPKLAGMTDAQRHVTEQTLFGKTAADQLDSTLQAGVGGWDTATAAVSRHGAVQDAAKKSSSTLEGETKTLKATLGDLGTKLGEALIPLVEKLAGVVSKVVGWFMQHKVAAEVLGGVLIGVLAVALAPLITSFSLVGAAVAAVIAVAVLLAANWTTVWDGIKSTFDTVWGALKLSFEEVVNTILGVVEGLLGMASHLPFVGSQFKGAEDSVKSFQQTLDASLGDANAQMSQATQNMDAFNQKAAAMGSSIRQVGPAAAGIGATFTSVGSGVKMSAKGGLFTTPTLSWIGESGPEQILSLQGVAA